MYTETVYTCNCSHDKDTCVCLNIQTEEQMHKRHQKYIFPHLARDDNLKEPILMETNICHIGGLIHKQTQIM